MGDRIVRGERRTVYLLDVWSLIRVRPPGRATRGGGATPAARTARRARRATSSSDRWWTTKVVAASSADTTAVWERSASTISPGARRGSLSPAVTAVAGRAFVTSSTGACCSATTATPRSTIWPSAAASQPGTGARRTRCRLRATVRLSRAQGVDGAICRTSARDTPAASATRVGQMSEVVRPGKR